MLFTLASISKKPAMLILRGILLQALLGFSFYSCFFFFCLASYSDCSDLD